MTLTVTWGTGSSARAWSLPLPDIAAVAKLLPAPTGVSGPTRATAKRALGVVEPFVIFAAEAAGAGVPELSTGGCCGGSRQADAVRCLSRSTRTCPNPCAA